MGQHKTHGASHTSPYNAWRGMLKRCGTPSTASYPNYGGRGIAVCDRWKMENGYINFIADLGPKPTPAHSLERINVDGNYEPSNCRWATSKEQAANRRPYGTIDKFSARELLTDLKKRTDDNRMRRFVTTSGVTFLFENYEGGSPVGALTPPRIPDMLEFAAFINEERAAIERGPQIVGTDLPKLLLNGGFFSIVSDETIPQGAIHFLNEMGRRVVLREGRGYRFRAESPGEGGTPTIVEVPDSGEGLPLAGATVVAELSKTHLQQVAQQFEGGNGTADQEL